MSINLISFGNQIVKLHSITGTPVRILTKWRLKNQTLGSINHSLYYSQTPLSEGTARRKVGRPRKKPKLSTDVINVSEKKIYETNTKVVRLHPSKFDKSIGPKVNSTPSLKDKLQLVDSCKSCNEIPTVEDVPELNHVFENTKIPLIYETLYKENLTLGNHVNAEDPDQFFQLNLLGNTLAIPEPESQLSSIPLDAGVLDSGGNDSSNLNKIGTDVSLDSKNKIKKKRKKAIKSKESKTKVSDKEVKSDRKDLEIEDTSMDKDDLVKRFMDFRKETRVHMQNKLVSSTLSVCFNVGLDKEAMLLFRQFNQSQRSNQGIHIDVYNVILKGIANKDNFCAMQPIIKKLRRSSIKPDHNTFASIFCCLGKEVNGNEDSIFEMNKWMEEENVPIESVVQKAWYMGNSKELALKAIEVFNPNIKDLYTTELNRFRDTISYNNDLVNSLNDSIFGTKIDSPLKGMVNLDDMQSGLEKQVLAETQGYLEVKNIKTADNSQELLDCREQLKVWDAEWRSSLKEAFLAQREFHKASFYEKSEGKMELYPYLITLEPEEFVDLMIMEVHNLGMGSEWFSLPQHVLSSKIGQNVFNRYLIKYQIETGLLDKLKDFYIKYYDWYLNRSDPDQSYIPRIQCEKILREMGTNSQQLFDSPPEWPYVIRKAIGTMLYNIMILRVTISAEVKGKSFSFPALYKVQRQYTASQTVVKSEVKPSPKLIEVFFNASIPTLKFPANSLPMVSPPLPWTTINTGGYLFSRADFIRSVQNGQQQRNQLEQSVNGELFPVMDSLNQLASMPWKINTNILDLIIEIFNNGGWPDMEIPTLIKSDDVPPVTSKMTPMEQLNARKALVEHEKLRNESYSLWCNALYKLSIANHYRDIITWLPQNLDFRGRTYPLPPHFSHIASDLFRALMLFANGKPLGKDGLSWLKLHLINLTGIKKRCSIQDRLDFCDEVLDKIMDSADNPRDGEMWWTDADEPWQCLAACKELTAALRSSSPEDFVSHLPIHQDGSCNGLQHYAALGRDKVGAKSVNLSPGIIPQDVYSDVVALVEEGREKDAKNGLAVAQALEGYVMRKVIKQTVMTTVYGVTRFGAKLQIAKQLKYIDSFPEESTFVASAYLSKKTFDSLGTMFTSTKNIQDWFVVCAEGITKVCMQNVDWVTPLGFPVVQPYSKLIKSTAVPKRLLNNLGTDGCNNDAFLQPMIMKQKNAFPPNFIHSLDSSHMMLTALYCQQKGINFVSVHDCFWTHACTVDIMNKTCREQFVALHSRPVLKELSDHFLKRYGGLERASSVPYTLLHTSKERGEMSTLKDVIAAVPKTGEFDINEVLDSVFFFS